MLKTVIIIGPRKPVFGHGPTKLDSNQFTQLQRLARKMKAVAQSNYQTYLVLRELKPAMRAIYSEIVTLVIILLVIPAANATSERTFSALRRVKTRMNNLITLQVHKERTDALDLKAIANEFTARNERRRCMFGKF